LAGAAGRVVARGIAEETRIVAAAVMMADDAGVINEVGTHRAP
jgi:hypothetical protein